MSEGEDVWRALSDPARRRILDLLRARPMTTGALAAELEATRFAVMNHLAVLTAAGLVTVERRGRERWNHLNAAPLVAMVKRWVTPFDAAWAERLTALAAVAGRDHREDRMPDTVENLDSPLRLVDLRQEIVIAAPPERVFRALTAQLGEWWGAPQLVRKDATGVALDPRVGGIMGETWPEGGGQAWATVEGIDPPRLLQLTGRMMMPGCVAGWIRYALAPEGAGTRLTLEHRAVGAISAETKASYDDGWRDLHGRLKRFIETGARSGLAVQ